MKILLDPGHGSNTPGKRSPDGRFLEYRFNRDIALDVQKQLTLSGYDATILVPEDYDVSLRARTERVNTWCRNLASATSAWFPSTPTQPATGGSG